MSEKPPPQSRLSWQQTVIGVLRHAMKVEGTSPEGKMNWRFIVLAMLVALAYLFASSLGDGVIGAIYAGHKMPQAPNQFNLFELLWTLFAFFVLCVIFVTVLDRLKPPPSNKSGGGS